MLFLRARGRRAGDRGIRAAGRSGKFRSGETAVAAARKKAETLAAYSALVVIEPLGGELEQSTLA
jgi:hypothetical protein